MSDRDDRTTKRCGWCSEVKPTSEFYRDAKAADGLRPECKACRNAHRDREYDKRYYRDNRGKIIERSRAWAQDHPEQNRRNHRRYYRRHRDEIRRRKKDQHNPIKARARNAVTRAIASGELVRHPCIKCSAEPSEAHHHLGYEEEHKLDVQWLCRKCHAREHAGSE